MNWWCRNEAEYGCKKDGEQELWTKQNGHLLWEKQRSVVVKKKTVWKRWVPECTMRCKVTYTFYIVVLGGMSDCVIIFKVSFFAVPYFHRQGHENLWKSFSHELRCELHHCTRNWPVWEQHERLRWLLFNNPLLNYSRHSSSVSKWVAAVRPSTFRRVKRISSYRTWDKNKWRRQWHFVANIETCK